MNDELKDEHVYRAAFPSLYKKKNGRISDAAFIDNKGASVELQCNRTDETVCSDMWTYLRGFIISIGVPVCSRAKVIVYDDDSSNKFHRLLLDENYKNNETMALSDAQAHYLAEHYDKIFEKNFCKK